MSGLQKPIAKAITLSTLSLVCIFASVLKAQEEGVQTERPLELAGLVIGASLKAVETRFPRNVVSEEVYRDERVGDRYSLILGRTIPSEITLRAWGETEGSPFTVDAAFTGNGEMHELIITERKQNLVCNQLRAEFIESYGEPKFSQGKVNVWVRFTLDDRRFLRLDCEDGQYYLGHLYSSNMQDRFLEELRREMEPIILQTLNFLQ